MHLKKSNWICTLVIGSASALALGSTLPSCSPSCEELANCGPAPTAGTSGDGGEAGTTPDPGTGGTHPQAGTSGDGGGSGGGVGDAGGSGGGASGSAGDTGAAGAGGTGTLPCDPTKSPHEEGCLVSDDFAIFVSPVGNDSDPGTQDAPLASLTKAVELSAGAKLVLVCTATYDEHVNITTGAQVFGGFDCNDWTPAAAKPLFKPSTAGPALKIDTVPDKVLLENVSFEVGDALTAGETALTALVNASPTVILRAVWLTAGKGKAGANGILSNFGFPEVSALNGYAESPAKSGGDEKPCSCQGALMSVGGLGGPPSSSGLNGAKGLPDHGGGTGGDPALADCGGGSSGKKGSDAASQAPGIGAATLGSANGAGWISATGADGGTGNPGQGGGGGASLNSLGHGGGGGCGGCGGNGGTAGKGGGASIALLALSSPVALEATVLTTADAGNGGNGATGQPGQQQVGVGGGTVSVLNSCPGGVGGKGGAGGAGGGGAGGISVGIVWKGAMEPTLSTDTTVTNGKPGAKGIGGTPGSNDGIAGVAQKILQLN